ncbi:MAG: hypothetical protein M0036_16920 [Desulfobacteraceae bacterium]|nr:hypothetical protein [Desulfobacteraceae bacterium]
MSLLEEITTRIFLLALFLHQSLTKCKIIGIDDEYKTIELGNVGSINLVLEKIDWYKPIEVVPGGHTAGLHFHGTGLNMLRKNLKELKEHEYLSIVA